MFIGLNEEREDEDEVVTLRQVGVNIDNILWFQPCEDDPEKTYLEMKGTDSMVVAESYNEVWNRIREVTR